MKKKAKYGFRRGSRLDGDKAQDVGEHLEGLRAASGSLTAARVVKDAKARRSPLHEFFQWDNTAAANEYRLEQARHLLRSLVVVYEHIPQHKEPVRAFVTFEKSEQVDRGAYIAVCDAMSNAELRKELVEQALGEAQEWQKRYEGLVELKAIFEAIAKAKAA
jgi:hypothetical protein